MWIYLRLIVPSVYSARLFSIHMAASRLNRIREFLFKCLTCERVRCDETWLALTALTAPRALEALRALLVLRVQGSEQTHFDEFEKAQ